MTPDEPGSAVPGGSPPPSPYPRTPASTPAATAAPPTGPVPVVTRKRRRRGRLFWLVVGLIIGLLIGVGGGYLLFNGKKTTVTTSPVGTTQSAAPTARTTPSGVATSQPVVTAVPLAQGVVPCPVATPLDQHPLGTPGPPGQGQTQDPTLDFCGAGNATIPTGTTRFMTVANWGVGVADSCPVGSSGEGGMGTVLTVSEMTIGGGAGPDPAVTYGGDWVDSGATLMPTGGNYQLQVTAVSPSCVWRINIYPSS
jgi:hypothetical protein